MSSTLPRNESTASMVTMRFAICCLLPFELEPSSGMRQDVLTVPPEGTSPQCPTAQLFANFLLTAKLLLTRSLFGHVNVFWTKRAYNKRRYPRSRLVISWPPDHPHAQRCCALRCSSSTCNPASCASQVESSSCRRNRSRFWRCSS